jgi:hypothetical protein
MMKAIMFAVASIFVVTASATESVARPYCPNATGFQTGARERSPLPRDAHRRSASRSYGATSARRGVGPRPSRWCGWWMRTQKGGGSELNLARNWKNWGRPTGPRVGAVVVWNHHVGMITGRTADGNWIVKSGNDGGRVRERPRSVAGAVFRI